MKIVLSDYISWQYCLLFLVILLFIIWLIFGGQENLQYIGLSPLKIGVDATRNVEHDTEKESEEIDEPIDRTPTLPDIFNKEDINFTHVKTGVPIISISSSYETSKVVEADNFEGNEGNFEGDLEGKKIEEKSPRSLALGEFQCYKNEKMSKGEKLCKEVIEDIYGVPFYCVRPNFLKNPETGRNLELDLYNDSLKIAVEYSGIGHYKYPNPFHKTREEFINQVRRDQFKVDMCDANGVYLITVPYSVNLEYDAIRKYIEYYLPERHAKRLEGNIQ